MSEELNTTLLGHFPNVTLVSLYSCGTWHKLLDACNEIRCDILLTQQRFVPAELELIKYSTLEAGWSLRHVSTEWPSMGSVGMVNPGAHKQRLPGEQ